jgi:hypothetical protein
MHRRLYCQDLGIRDFTSFTPHVSGQNFSGVTQESKTPQSFVIPRGCTCPYQFRKGLVQAMRAKFITPSGFAGKVSWVIRPESGP